MLGVTPQSLVVVLLLGLCVFYSVELVRSLPFVSVAVANSKKPWACHICMSFWGSLAWHLALIYFAGASLPYWLTLPATSGVCLLLMYWTDKLVAGAQPSFTD